MPRASYGDKFTVTVMKGEEQVMISMIVLGSWFNVLSPVYFS
jgi:hypothetical protein